MEEDYQDAPEPPPVDPVRLLAGIMQSENVADLLDEKRLSAIADECLRGYEIDKQSQKDWKERMERGIALASLVKDEKTYPFKNASNVKYPLVTTAALQFNARAYPAVVPAAEPVKTRVHGNDPDGMKAARGERVSEYMSFQLLNEIEEWEETTDKLLNLLPIVGTMFRKVWYDPGLGRARCRLVDPGAFIVNNKAKTLTDAPRGSEELYLFPNEIAKRRRSGRFRDIDYVEVEGQDTQAAQEFIEQHCLIDLDEDGYEEPYIVIVHKKSQLVARIVADFREEDVTWSYRTEEVPAQDPDTGMVFSAQQEVPDRVIGITRGSYFVAYHFLPSLDGGFMGTGFGLLLGDISESINSIINQMMDAGHMASRGGGFIGKDFRIKGGAQQFRPGEWKPYNASGQDIRNSIVPLTFPGPDATLFQLLGLLIEAAKDVSSIKDVITGDTGSRQMTATTTIALIEQGLAQFTAAYKRIFRALKNEFRLLARINAEHLNPEKYSAFHDMRGHNGGPQLLDPQADFNLDDMDIEPVADPTAVTKMQEAAKAQLTMQLAEAGLVDPQEAARRIVEASSLGDTEALMPKPDPMAEMAGQLQAQMMQADATMKIIEVDQKLADLEKTRSETIKNMTDAAATEFNMRLDDAKQALEAVKVGLQAALGGGAERMARPSGNQTDRGIAPRNAGPGAGSPDLAVLVGPSGPGIGPAVIPPQGGAMGRPL